MIDIQILKAANTGRMVYGWGSVSKIRNTAGEFVDYVDTDNEQFPEDVTVAAWTEYMLSERTADDMHDETSIGTVVFAMPMTEDIAKAFGILDALMQTGVMVGVRIDDDAVLEKFRSGEYTGFSIGGSARFEDIDE